METYYGYVHTPDDALKLFEACRLGLLPRVQRRLSAKERQSIRSGSIFVWDEREAGLRRWTDGKSWSASRASGSFLVYREVEGKERGGLSGGCRRIKVDGLTKQSFSITTSASRRLHLVSYFSHSSEQQAHLPQPTRDPTLRHINPDEDIYAALSKAEANQTPAVTQNPMTQETCSILHQQPSVPQYARSCYARMPTRDHLPLDHTSNHSAAPSHYSLSVNSQEQPQALPPQPHLEKPPCPLHQNNAPQCHCHYSDHSHESYHQQDIQPASQGLATQLPSFSSVFSHSVGSQPVVVSRRNSTESRRSRANSPAPQGGLDPYNYFEQQGNPPPSPLPDIGTKTNSQKNSGRGDQLVPDMMPRVVPYEEVQCFKSELLAMKQENEILKQRIWELERQMQDRRAYDTSHTGSGSVSTTASVVMAPFHGAGTAGKHWSSSLKGDDRMVVQSSAGVEVGAPGDEVKVGESAASSPQLLYQAHVR